MLKLLFLIIIVGLAFIFKDFTKLVLICLFIILIYGYIRKFIIWRKVKISDIDNMNGFDFEHYVAKLLKKQGYYNIEVTKASGDFGIDILANIDDESYAIQVKRYTGKVPRNAVSDAIAGRDFYNCDNAMVITNSYFSKGAIEMAEEVGCILVDREELILWISHNY